MVSRFHESENKNSNFVLQGLKRILGPTKVSRYTVVGEAKMAGSQKLQNRKGYTDHQIYFVSIFSRRDHHYKSEVNQIPSSLSLDHKMF